jgi:glycerol-3-phosphate O-acyltransferase
LKTSNDPCHRDNSTWRQDRNRKQTGKLMLTYISQTFDRLTNIVRGRFDKWLDGTRNHFTNFLPERTGYLSSLVLKLFYSGITLKKDQIAKIKSLPEESIIIYVTKYKSAFEHLFYHTRFFQEKLPTPEISFEHRMLLLQPVSRIFKIFLAGMGHFLHNFSFPDPFENEYFEKELMNGRVATLSLVEKSEFYRRFIKAGPDPLRHLIEIQSRTKRPVYLVPKLMFFGKSPSKSVPTITEVLFGSEEKPGRARRLITLFKNPGTVFVELSEPVSLREFILWPQNQNRSLEQKTTVLRRNLLLQINKHRQSITGPVLKSRQELKESILTSDRLKTFMDDYCQKNDISIYQARKEADQYLEEIASNYNLVVIRIFSVVITWFLKIMFSGVTTNYDMLNQIKDASRKGPLILIPCHKSHIDYLILSYIMFHHNMPCPLVAAGKNLSFWPMGPFFRNAGAFFIRRSFKGKKLYVKIFSEYIGTLLKEGFNIEFFIEGGRSRTGKMILPKLGLLSFLLKAYQEGACDDLIFTPIYIGYDRVLEENAYLKELEGGQKEPESFGQIIKARKFLKKKYGRIYVKFHEPISFKEMAVQNTLNMESMEGESFKSLCRYLGHRFINAINTVSVVTPHAVVASALLNINRRRLPSEQLLFHIDTYMTHLYARKATLADTLIMDPAYAFKQVIDIYEQRKFIERIPLGKDNDLTDEVFMVNEVKRPNLEYYKNNCINFFIPAAFTAISILQKDAFQFSASDLQTTYAGLQDLFKNEFTYSKELTPDYSVRKNIKTFIDDAIIVPHPTLPDRYNMTSTGYKKLLLFSCFLKTYLESYLIVLTYFSQTAGSNESSKDQLKKIEAVGTRMYKTEEIQNREALSKINYKNAIKLFTSREVLNPSNRNKIGAYLDTIRNFLKLLSS